MYSRIIIHKIIALLLILTLAITAHGSGSRFSSGYSCSDGSKSCQSTGIRTVEGFQVHKSCWEYSYPKTCNYPSKNNCSSYAHCYLVAFRECLLTDSLGNCVNQLKEYSCKRWELGFVNKEKVRYGKEEKEGVEQLVCKGIPCIDGHCVDKSYNSNNEMMDSVSRLYAISEMKGVTDLNFKLFAGYAAHCSKKPTDYSNCCKLNGGANNWGHNLGARCSKDEQTLIEQRKKNLCVYVGKSTSGSVLKINKHHWCCFGNILNKVLQVEGRKQLGMSFGSGGNTDCRGLTLEELLRLDFDKMDFTEFEAEILKKMKLPKDNDLQERIRGSMPNVQKPKDELTASENMRDGINQTMVDDSWEAMEEKRLESERLARLEAERLAKLEKERLEQLEAQRLEQERLAVIERERKRLAEEELKKSRLQQEILSKTNAIKYLEDSKQHRAESWNALHQQYGGRPPQSAYDDINRYMQQYYQELNRLNYEISQLKQQLGKL